MSHGHQSDPVLRFGRRLLLGWRKGRSRQDLPMWATIQLTLVLPALITLIGVASHGKSLPAVLASPLFWLVPVLGLSLLIYRLHFLATRIGCTRQINISEDGMPTECMIDSGHPECCKHIGPGGDKRACPYWKPALIVD
jgi:hypothetical protein